jgi:hypothetical protein
LAHNAIERWFGSSNTKENTMHRYLRLIIPAASAIGLAAAALTLQSPGIHKASASEGPKSCNIEMTRALYGFQCHGYGNVGAGLEPVTFVGTVRGDGRGTFEGYGTFNSSNGSASTHVKGTGDLLPQCFGHVRYGTNEILLPGGGAMALPPIAFDYTVVDNGNEILGSGVAEPAGGVGSSVPRLTCRLVNTRR